MHWFFKVSLVFVTLFFIVFFVSFVRPKIMPQRNISNTEKYGVIFQNEHWSGEIRITGDIWSLPGVIITVEPGTRILVENHGDRSNMDFIPMHWKFGVNSSQKVVNEIRPGEPFLDEKQKISLRFFKFYAEGTNINPIIIQSASIISSPYDFNLIYIKAGVLSNVNLGNFRRLEIGSNTTIRNSDFRDIGECAVCILGSNPLVLDNIFNRSLRDYIWIDGGSPKITGNLFLPIKGQGIVVDTKKYGHPQIQNNEFQIPGQMAIYFLNGGEKIAPLISTNFFAAGDIQIPCNSKAIILNNYIRSNLVFSKSGNCIGKFYLGVNYWESFDAEKIIKQRIVGTEPQFEVYLQGILSESPINIEK